MGQDIELNFDKHGIVDLSPTTVLPLNRRRSDVENRTRRNKLTRRDELLTIQEEFTEINFSRYRSTSCKNIPSKQIGLESNSEGKRGSVYQSSREVRQYKNIDIVEGRKKIEMSGNSRNLLPIQDFDSLCSFGEESSKKKSSVVSSNPELSKMSFSRIEEKSFFEICVGSDSNEKFCAEIVERDGIVDLNSRCDEVCSPQNDGNEPLERDMVRTLHKSLSAKVENGHTRLSQKSRFGPIKKMFDPFTKSKSMRSPLSSEKECDEVKTNGISRKSLLNDFSNTEQNIKLECHDSMTKNRHFIEPCSPAHLQGHLKVENKNGVPFFEFFLKCPEEVFVAKTWKLDNSFNWVYTFHSIQNKRNSNAYGRISKDSNKESSSMVGQMQVSCYLRSEPKNEAFDNSMVTEYVLYDIAHVRKSVVSKESSNLSSENFHKKSNYECSVMETQDLIPNLEIAAIVIQTPFEKRESLKNKKGLECFPNLPLPKMNVVIPSGIHGLENTENHGPSSLLDRWRMNGGCDCGGWDMACPLNVFSNSSNHLGENHSRLENQWPLKIHAQGAKETIPALIVALIEEGHYTVDFHARLSTLQAFSICVAILHNSEPFPIVRSEEHKHMLLQSNSLRVLMEDEVKLLIEAVTTREEKMMKNVSKDNPPQSFVLNPPFSPIARV